MNYYGHQASRTSFIRDSKGPSKVSLLLPIYLSVVAVLGALSLLGICLPIWLAEIGDLEKFSAEEFAAVKIRSETAWKQLLQIESDDNSVSWARIRRKTNDEYNIYGYDQPESFNNEAAYDAGSRYMATPLAVGYSTDETGPRQCCCNPQNMNSIDFDSLPVSWRCPVGSKGSKGQRGPVGEPGENGERGKPGLDYLFVIGESAAVFDGAPAALPYSYSRSLGSYGSAVNSSPRICEPCPAGPSGPEGPKGRPGNVGPKGMPGPSGRNGFHGIPGIPGPDGLIGNRGQSGLSGVPGPNGADAVGGAKGAPGVQGRRGDTGIIGVRGPSGPNGQSGRPGIMGFRGNSGIKGQRGMDGVDGPSGRPGSPGEDGMYCHCPTRSEKVEFNNDNTYLTSPSAYGLERNNYWSTNSPSYPRSSSWTTTTRPPVYTRPQINYNQDQHSKKIYVSNQIGIPMATQRNFATTRSTPIYNRATPSASLSTNPNSEYDERPFVGKDAFSNQGTWRTRNNEDETYGVDVAWLEQQAKRKQHRIA
ncbi:hypothetical protein FO519_005006 [Halicephalobus sp. NKZ332]|nr:hypothetical protein FO519_005006 [Halicephalobus sp. NKZ332]